MAGPLDGKRILILATNGFEQSELEVPRDKLKAAGATVEVASPETGEIKGWDKKDWGRPVRVDKALASVKAADYDAIVLPGGQINPDLLRVNKDALIEVSTVTLRAARLGNLSTFSQTKAGLTRRRRSFNSSSME